MAAQLTDAQTPGDPLMFELGEQFCFEAVHTLQRQIDAEPSCRIHGHVVRQRRARWRTGSALSRANRYNLFCWAGGSCGVQDADRREGAAENVQSTALGRKNYLFAGSDSGGERAATIYTRVATAKLNGLNPETYLRDILAKIAEGLTINRIDELVPWRMIPAAAASPR
jgi:IS66 C-terminal element